MRILIPPVRLTKQRFSQSRLQILYIYVFLTFPLSPFRHGKRGRGCISRNKGKGAHEAALPFTLLRDNGISAHGNKVR